MRILFSLVSVLGLTACGGGGNVKVFLTDAPLDGATAVNVHVTAVEIIGEGGVDAQGQGQGASSEGRVRIAVDRTLNLLDFRDGKKTLLGEAEVEGPIEQIRLHMDGNVTVVYEGAPERTARVPSGAQTGIKIVTRGIDPAEHEEIVLDFDAAQSIHEANGELIMRPTIKVLLEGEVHAESEAVE